MYLQKKKGHFCYFPQLFDLKKIKKNYQNFFRGINNQNSNLKILDLTSNFMKNYKDLFVNDKYGVILTQKEINLLQMKLKK